MSTDSPVIEEKEIYVLDFGIEIDHPRNDNVLIQSLHVSLRSAIDGTKGSFDDDGVYTVPTDQITALASFPKTPGMCIKVQVKDRRWFIYDPLSGSENETILEEVNTFLKKNRGGRVKPVPSNSGTLDAHTFKTLVREMKRLVDLRHAKPTQGSIIPSDEDIEELPGNFLLNPGSTVHNTQPRFEKDWDAWLDQLSSHGG